VDISYTFVPLFANGFHTRTTFRAPPIQNMATASSIQIAVAISNDKHQLGRTFLTQVLELLKEVRGINVDVVNSTPPSRVSIPASSTISDVLSALSTALSSASKQLEAETFDHVLSKCLEKISFGGLGLSDQSIEEESDRTDTLFLVDAWLEALNSQDRAKGALPTTTLRAKGTRPMTLTEKIFAHHTLGGCPVEGLKAGDVIRASLDWVSPFLKRRLYCQSLPTSQIQ